MNSRLIDDDFESVFRRMLDALRDSIAAFPEVTSSFSFYNDSMSNDLDEEEIIPSTDESEVERIDLQDTVLFLVNIGYTDKMEYSVKVDDKGLRVTHTLDGKETRIDLDFDVDMDFSSASYRNGVLEISLKIDKNSESRKKEGYLEVN